MNHHTGFSVTELLVTVSISAILLSIAVPGIQTFILDNRASMQINSMLTSLYISRSEAIKRDAWVVMCKKNESSSNCVTSGDWTQGWIIFIDNNRNASVNDGDEVLRVHESLEGSGVSFSGTADVANYIAFDSIGMSRLTNGNAQSGRIVLCDSRGFGSNTSVIIQNANGSANAIKAGQDASITSCS